MAVEADVIYRDRDTIRDQMIASLLSRIPDAYTGEDGQLRMLFEIMAESVEGVYLANQILRDNIFIQRANLTELRLHGEMFGLPIKLGTKAQGTLRVEGAGGTVIPAGTIFGSDPGTGDVLYFLTKSSVTIPNPGVPSAPVIADAGAGLIEAGTYEYAVTFVTADGETEAGFPSNALVIAASHNISLTSIPLGGPGTISRKLYRRLNGSAWGYITTIPNNTGTTYTDSTPAASVGFAIPPTDSTAERISIASEAENEGQDWNVVVGTVNEVVDAPTGVSGVTNTTAFTGGSDEEDLEDYRIRLLDHVRNPDTGSKADLEAWAEEITGVEEATAFPNENLGVATNGHVTIRISGPDATTPDAATQQAVLDALNARDIANITIHVTTFTAVSTNVAVTITLQAGYILADVTPAVQAAIRDYILGVPVGGTIYVAGIVDAVFGLPGVATVVVTTPSSDLTSTATQKRTPGTITVS